MQLDSSILFLFWLALGCSTIFGAAKDGDLVNTRDFTSIIVKAVMTLRDIFSDLCRSFRQSGDQTCSPFPCANTQIWHTSNAGSGANISAALGKTEHDSITDHCGALEP